MNPTILFKMVLVVSLTVVGLGLSLPAGAANYPPCSESYCAPPNQGCVCECVEGDGQLYRCYKAPPICFA